MSEGMWAEPSEDEFALPGDNERLAAIAVEERPRNEKGQFVSTKEEAPEEEPAEEPQVEEPQAEEPAAEEPDPIASLLEKYGGDVTEVAKALRESQSLIGRQGQELSELRRMVEEHFSRQPLPGNFEQLLDERPDLAAREAYERGDRFALQRAVQAWEEMSPGAPALWGETLKLRQELDERMVAIEERFAPATQAAANYEFASSARQLRERYPDLNEVLGTPEAQEAVERFPTVTEILTSGSAEAKIGALESLYLITRGLTADTRAKAASEVAQEAAQAAAEAKAEAQVASATRTGSEPAPSLADRIAAEWEAEDARYSDGWNV